MKSNVRITIKSFSILQEYHRNNRNYYFAKMADFKVSAPCRLNLFGEHAVEYGKTCLTAAIDLRTTLTFQELPLLKVLLISCPQIQLSLHLPLEKFLKFYDNCVENKMELLRERVLQFTDDSYKSDKHKKIVQAFYYLLVLIIYEDKLEIKSFHMNLSTELLVNEELVCSASSIVCVTACLLHWSRLQKGIDSSAFNFSDLIKIKRYAARCEEICPEYKLANVTVCTYGSIVKYNTVADTAYTSALLNIPRLSILLVDSKIQNLTTQTHVRDLMNEDSVHVNDILNQIDCDSKTAYNVFQKLVEYNNKPDFAHNREHLLTEYNKLKVNIIARTTKYCFLIYVFLCSYISYILIYFFMSFYMRFTISL